MGNRLFIKITRDTLPQVKDKYPFIYLERGRIEIDDSSVKWIDSEANVVRLPIATLSSILLGPGTSVTHEAIKVLGSSNCLVCWVGEDSLRFYASGISPTSDTRNFQKQLKLFSNKQKSLLVARKMFSRRFPEEDLSSKTLKEMMGMEGHRVRALYREMADKYGVGWKSRNYAPGRLELSDTTNQYLSVLNSMLYAIVLSVVLSLGYSPYVGFIHTGSPLPFIYDVSDLYKDFYTIELSFFLTFHCSGKMKRDIAIDEFRSRLIENKLLDRIVEDILWLMEA